MHPTFYIPDTHVSHDIAHHHDCKHAKRRGAAGRMLRLIPAPGWPPLCPHLPDLVTADLAHLPSGRPLHTPPVLQIVPDPQWTLRNIIGRFLIRLGQRMILKNASG